MGNEPRGEPIYGVEHFPRSMEAGLMLRSDRVIAEVFEVEGFSSKECTHRAVEK